MKKSIWSFVCVVVLAVILVSPYICGRVSESGIQRTFTQLNAYAEKNKLNAVIKLVDYKAGWLHSTFRVRLTGKDVTPYFSKVRRLQNGPILACSKLHFGLVCLNTVRIPIASLIKDPTIKVVHNADLQVDARVSLAGNFRTILRVNNFKIASIASAKSPAGDTAALSNAKLSVHYNVGGRKLVVAFGFTDVKFHMKHHADINLNGFYTKHQFILSNKPFSDMDSTVSIGDLFVKDNGSAGNAATLEDFKLHIQGHYRNPHDILIKNSMIEIGSLDVNVDAGGGRFFHKNKGVGALTSNLKGFELNFQGHYRGIHDFLIKQLAYRLAYFHMAMAAKKMQGVININNAHSKLYNFPVWGKTGRGGVTASTGEYYLKVGQMVHEGVENSTVSLLIQRKNYRATYTFNQAFDGMSFALPKLGRYSIKNAKEHFSIGGFDAKYYPALVPVAQALSDAYTHAAKSQADTPALVAAKQALRRVLHHILAPGITLTNRFSASINDQPYILNLDASVATLQAERPLLEGLRLKALSGLFQAPSAIIGTHAPYMVTHNGVSTCQVTVKDGKIVVNGKPMPAFPLIVKWPAISAFVDQVAR
ncbi:MAG: DUF945 family protein [Candidatus Lindowbacteria bacterium]|nr:DUF945 family protein [Candidatus Lindowbacteria bacterium]